MEEQPQHQTEMNDTGSSSDTSGDFLTGPTEATSSSDQLDCSSDLHRLAAIPCRLAEGCLEPEQVPPAEVGVSAAADDDHLQVPSGAPAAPEPQPEPQPASIFQHNPFTPSSTPSTTAAAPMPGPSSFTSDYAMNLNAAHQAYAQHVAHQLLYQYPDHYTGIEKLILASIVHDPNAASYLNLFHPSQLPQGRGLGGHYKPSVAEYETIPTPRTRGELELYRILERAHLLNYYTIFLDYGADDVSQLVEADEDEFLEIMSLVGMTRKPLHVRRLQRALHEWQRHSQKKPPSQPPETRPTDRMPPKPLASMKKWPTR